MVYLGTILFRLSEQVRKRALERQEAYFVSRGCAVPRSCFRQLVILQPHFSEILIEYWHPFHLGLTTFQIRQIHFAMYVCSKSARKAILRGRGNCSIH